MTDIDAAKQFRHLILRLLVHILEKNHNLDASEYRVVKDVEDYIRQDSPDQDPHPNPGFSTSGGNWPDCGHRKVHGDPFCFECSPNFPVE